MGKTTRINNTVHTQLPVPILFDGPTAISGKISKDEIESEILSLLHASKSLTDQIKHVKCIGQQQQAIISPLEFRVLLEWMCSDDIPPNLRRVLQSNLNRVLNANDTFSSHVDDVFQSLLECDCGSSQLWKNPVQSLNSMLDFDQGKMLSKTENFVAVLGFLIQHARRLDKNACSTYTSCGDNLLAQKQRLDVTSTLNIVLSGFQLGSNASISSSGIDKQHFGELLHYLLGIFLPAQLGNNCASNTDSEALRVSGIVLARVIRLRFVLEQDEYIDLNSDNFAHFIRKQFLKTELSSHDCVPSPYELSELGRVALLRGISQITSSDDNMFLTVGPFLVQKMIEICSLSTNVTTRLASLRALESMLSSLSNYVMKNEPSFKANTNFLDESQIVAQDALEIALVNWQSNTRQISAAVQPVFNSAIKILQANGDSDKEFDILQLLDRILAQPANRKGKYLALEIILQRIGARTLIECSPHLIPSLIDAIGDVRGNHAGAITDLTVAILQSFLEGSPAFHQMIQQENKRHQKNKSSKLHNILEVPPCLVHREWLSLWTKPLIYSLIYSERQRATQVSNFCIGPMLTMAGTSQAPHICDTLLDEISKEEKLCKSRGNRFLWATLEILRWANFKNVTRYEFIQNKIISSYMPPNLLNDALMNTDMAIRLAGFSHLCDPHQPITEVNVAHLQSVLPYAMKSSSSNYVSKLLDVLSSFMKRFLSSDNHQYLLRQFLLFLCEQLFLKQLGYPGTVLEKEKMALPLLECVFSFVTESLMISTPTLDVEGNNARKQTGLLILQRILCSDMILSLISLLHSIWDNTRIAAFQLIIKIIEYATNNSLQLPKVLSCENEREKLIKRAHLFAQSARERESDTGAMMFAILFVSVQKTHRDQFLGDLLHTLDRQVNAMDIALKDITDESLLVEGQALPLVHGYIEALSLCLDQAQVNFSCDSCRSQNFICEIVTICCRALDVSLSVVSDFNKNEDGLFQRAGQKGTPLNVNTGAIGANGVFSAIDSSDKEEMARRSGMQRVIMGCWLLTKHACAALAVSGCYSFNNKEYLSSEIISMIGLKLVSTIVSLKHAGGSFAAHKALQDISCTCQKVSTLAHLPQLWSTFLMKQISSPEYVRDSILRRSTGYALGFLAIMRSDLLKGSSHLICPMVLSYLLRLSLPPMLELKAKFMKLGLSEFQFTFMKDFPNLTFIENDGYQWKSRVHALNILRLAILDAPLAREIKRYISDAIISSLIGYDDSSWAVRNSSTMVYSSVMLRVIDADKNATRTSSLDSKTSKNAITAHELFRLYPSLSPFLVSLLRENVKESFDKCSLSNESVLHPSLFPILLLLSRLQPVSDVAADVGAIESVAQFIQPVLTCLSHPHHKVRLMSSRAIGALCSGDGEGMTTRSGISARCLEILEINSKHYNVIHGSLLCLFQLMLSQGSKEWYRKISERIVNISKISNDKLSYPPSCIAVALNICWIARKKGFVEEDSTFPLDSTCTSTIKTCIKLIPFNLIGLSHLCCEASKIFIDELYPNIFSIEVKCEDRQSNLQRLRWLIDLPFDISWIAVKAFKKPLNDKVRSIVRNVSYDVPIKIEVLKDIATALLESLCFHCTKFQGEIRSFDEVHAPTLRRLSRCILIILTGLRELRYNYEFERTTWPLFKWLSTIADNDASKKDKSCTGILKGNSLELMSFSLLNISPSPSNQIYLEDFLAAVKEAINPNLSWIIRYSAATAIDVCGLLYNATENGLRSRVQNDLFSVALQLLQDNDEDVRDAAVVVLSSISSGALSVSLLSLENSVLSIRRHGSNFERNVCDELLNEISDLRVWIENQFEFSCNAIQGEIFECEDPNPFKEQLLNVHLCANLLKDNASQNDYPSGIKLLQMCSFILNILSNAHIKSEIELREITYDYFAFPRLQALLLICTSLLLGGFDDDYGSIQEAKRFIDLDKHLDNRDIHPAIIEIASLLAQVKEIDKDKAKKSLKSCCFLAPSLSKKYCLSNYSSA